MIYRHLILMAILAPATAAADVQIQMASEAGQGADSILSVRDGHMRMEAKDGENVTMLFNAGSGTLTIVNHGDRNYMVMDDKAMDEMQGSIDAAMQQMQDRLADLPEDQRRMIMERMPQMMQQQNAPAEKPTYSVKNTGDKDVVAGIDCQNVTLLKNGQPEGRSCIAKPGAMKMSNGDYETIKAMFARLQSMAGRFSRDADNTPNIAALGGFPLRMTSSNGGDITVVTSVENKELDKTLFQIPPDYTQQTMPGMRQR